MNKSQSMASPTNETISDSTMDLDGPTCGQAAESSHTTVSPVAEADDESSIKSTAKMSDNDERIYRSGILRSLRYFKWKLRRLEHKLQAWTDADGTRYVPSNTRLCRVRDQIDRTNTVIQNLEQMLKEWLTGGLKDESEGVEEGVWEFRRMQRSLLLPPDSGR